MKWADKRARVVSRLKQTQLQVRGPAARELPVEGLRKLRRKLDRQLLEYSKLLPFRPVSRCPICDQCLELVMDDVALDGPWWWESCHLIFAPPLACSHYQVFLGALNLHGRVPAEANVWGVLPGPGVPFVVPQLLSLQGVEAVLSTIPLQTGDDAYLIVYYGEEAVPAAQLHQEWRKRTWIICNEAGDGVGRQVSNAVWDFHVASWISQGKLSWIEQGDVELALRRDLPSPYDRVDGVRKQQIVGDGTVKLAEPPDGTESGYYDRA